uniref:Charged multivesicular body protein 7 n=1 Tax=Haemonchus contortus TaxID=6289 RepID=A0A7I4Y100_HAECO
MISEDDWSTLMNKPQRDDRGKPLVLDQHQLEHVISDQLGILEEYRSMLAELRHEIIGEESILSGNGQDCLEELKTVVQNEASKLQELIASGIGHVHNAVTDATGKPSPPGTSEDAIDKAGDDSGGEGEGTEVLQLKLDPPEEAEVIQQNAEFMENVAVDD